MAPTTAGAKATSWRDPRRGRLDGSERYAPRIERPRPGPRARLAVLIGRIVAALSRLSRLGSGSVIGGRASLAVDPHLLRTLSRDLEVVLISGTNGKTTTTHLLASAMRGRGTVATNAEGANMGPGLVAALGERSDATHAVLEVDERWLPPVLTETGPAVVALLNLSRDQLDRTQEVRSIAVLWREALERLATRTVIANADDPLVVWAAGSAPEVTWVGAGALWTLDAVGCPSCGGRITFGDGDWSCSRCGFRRPEPALEVDDDSLVRTGGDPVPLGLALPGRANRANAAMAAAAAAGFGVGLDEAVTAMRGVRDVAGRYRSAVVGGHDVHMLLAKNPAGWQEALEVVRTSGRPVITAINARIADGRDPSWLWDVPFERLRGRFVVATGERRHDLAVRLAYAEVDHVIAEDLRAAVRSVGNGSAEHGPAGAVDLVANYTAFQDYRREVGR